MARIPVAPAEFQSTTRIPNTSQPGFEALGRGIQQVGAAAVNVAQEMRVREEMAMKAQEDKAAFDADVALQQYQIETADTSRVAALEATPDGSGQVAAGVEYMRSKSDKIDAQIANLENRGLHHIAADLRQKSQQVTARHVVALQDNEFDGRKLYETDALNRSREGLENAVTADPDFNDAQLAAHQQMVDNSITYTDLEKDIYQRESETLMKTREVEMAARANPELATEMVGGPRTNITQANSLLREFEGFREGTYFDMTRERLGYGSDTITLADGTVRYVKKGDVVSRADAERDLMRRTEIARTQIIAGVGPEAWARLPAYTQAALISVTYNYQSDKMQGRWRPTLQRRLADAVRTGDPTKIANAIRSLGGDNAGINRKRREREAVYAETGKLPGSNITAVSAGNDRYADLPFDVRSQLRTNAQAQYNAAGTSLNKQISQRQTAEDERLRLGIETGAITQPQTILTNDILSDGQKASRMSQLEERQKSSMAAAAFNSQLAQRAEGGPGPDYRNPNSRKAADNAFDNYVPAQNFMSDPAAMASAVEWGQATGYVPRAMSNRMLSAINAGPDGARELATLAPAMSMILDQQPDALQSRDGAGKITGVLEQFNRRIRSGETTNNAIKRIAELNDEAMKKGHNQLVSDHQSWIDENATVKGVKKIAAADAPWYNVWADDPTLGNTETQRAITEDYRQILKDSIWDTRGDVEAAETLAAKRFNHWYGVTSADMDGSLRYTKMPVEKAYPALFAGYDENGVAIQNHDWITYDLEMDVANFAGDSYTPGTAWLTPTIETQRQWGEEEHPAYIVSWMNPDGQVESYPEPWRPDLAGGVAAAGVRYEAERNYLAEQATTAAEADVELGAGPGRAEALEGFLEEPPALREQEPTGAPGARALEGAASFLQRRGTAAARVAGEVAARLPTPPEGEPVDVERDVLTLENADTIRETLQEKLVQWRETVLAVRDKTKEISDVVDIEQQIRELRSVLRRAENGGMGAEAAAQMRRATTRR
ncbi:MAG: glycoside hydrolase family protein [Planctomycetota bacterium]|jgi:GH24 family phage-related lysozyme (muramidase)